MFWRALEAAIFLAGSVKENEVTGVGGVGSGWRMAHVVTGKCV